MVMSYENLGFIVSLILPGWIISSMLRNAMFLQKTEFKESILKYFIYSLANNFFIQTILRLFDIEVSKSIIAGLNLVLAIIFTILMILINKGWKYLSKKRIKLVERINKFLNTLGFTRDVINTYAWDYIFYEIANLGKAYIIVELKDGDVIYGYFAHNSYASDGYKNYSDLYIEKIYEDSSFEKPINFGVLLFKEEIKSIRISNQKLLDN